MISARQPASTADIARHYNELDGFYRDLWGDHLHHGLWDGEDDDRSAESATIHLLEKLTAPFSFRAGQHFADIGCGYGAPARWLAARHGVHLTALTLSSRQLDHARQAAAPSQGSVDYRQEDWLQNSLPDASLDGAIAIEVLAHVADKAHFFRQLQRTLKPGASCAMALWTVPHNLTTPEQLLVRNLCRDGRLSGVGTLNAYRNLAAAAGLEMTRADDVSLRVERTWWVIARRALSGLLTNPRYLLFLLRRLFRQRLFLFTLPAMLLAYRTGALRYCLVIVVKRSQ